MTTPQSWASWPAHPAEVQRSPELAREDMKRYGRAMRLGDDTRASRIEKEWGLYGYTPEIVSTVLACVATGLPLEAAIDEATGGAA